MVLNKQELRRKYWATRSSVCLFARTAHSYACFELLASLALSAALTRLLTRLLCSLPRLWDSDRLEGYLFILCFFLFWTIVQWVLRRLSGNWDDFIIIHIFPFTSTQPSFLALINDKLICMKSSFLSQGSRFTIEKKIKQCKIEHHTYVFHTLFKRS